MCLSEFDIIRTYFQREQQSDSVIAGIGDDCALLAVTPGQYLAVSMDTLVAGRHFPLAATPYDIGRRALCVNISDIAAMAATPTWFTLGLTLPDANHEWLKQFSQGLFDIANRFHCALVGGDTTRGPLSITIQVHGQAAPEHVLTRDKAQAGDTVFVTGTLGDGAAALAMLEGRLAVDENAQHYLYERFYAPEPQVRAGLLLGPLSHSAIDISDGLLADLGHIARASDVAIEIDVEAIPLAPALASIVARSPQIWREWSLTGGDDYQLAFTVPAAHIHTVQQLIESGQLQATAIGRVNSTDTTPSVSCQLHGKPYAPPSTQGYQHFVAP